MYATGAKGRVVTKMSNEPIIRVQKSRDGRYVQLVLCSFDKEGKKRPQIYFSYPIQWFRDYLSGNANQKYLIVQKMFDKEDPKYKEFMRNKRKFAKQKREELQSEKAEADAASGSAQ